MLRKKRHLAKSLPKLPALKRAAIVSNMFDGMSLCHRADANKRKALHKRTVLAGIPDHGR